MNAVQARLTDTGREKQTMAAPLLEWKAEYLTGVASLDFEHQDMFARINELHDELMRHDEKVEIEACLGEIHARLQAHFALEERLMREAAYPMYREHKAEHDEFLDDFVDLMTQFENDPGTDLGNLLERVLSEWIVRHLVGSDKKLAALLKP